MHDIEMNKLTQTKMPYFLKLGNDIMSVFKKVEICADEQEWIEGAHVGVGQVAGVFDNSKQGGAFQDRLTSSTVSLWYCFEEKLEPTTQQHPFTGLTLENNRQGQVVHKNKCHFFKQPLDQL